MRWCRCCRASPPRSSACHPAMTSLGGRNMLSRGGSPWPRDCFARCASFAPRCTGALFPIHEFRLQRCARSALLSRELPCREDFLSARAACERLEDLSILVRHSDDLSDSDETAIQPELTPSHL